MQAITVRQPWAWAIARGHRSLSNQSLPTDHRGPLLVHAAMRVDLDSCDRPLIRAIGWDPKDPLAVLGAVIAVAQLTEVCDGGPACECGLWADAGAWHWKLADVRPLPRPVVALGRPGIWEPRPSLVQSVQNMLVTGLSGDRRDPRHTAAGRTPPRSDPAASPR